MSSRLAIPFVREVFASDADHGEWLRQQSVDVEVVESG